MGFQYSGRNVINIFTDASTTSNINGNSVGFVCSGFIAVQNDFVIGTDYVVLNGCTSQFGEIYAIMMGLTFMNTDVWGKRYTGRGLEVDISVYNLISDSLYSLTCLRKTLSEWVKFTDHAVANYQHPTFNYFHQYPTPPDLIKPVPDNKNPDFSFIKHFVGSKKKKKKKRHKDASDAYIAADQEALLHCMGLIVHNQKPINTYHIKGHLGENEIGIIKAREAFNKYNHSINPSDEELLAMIHWNNQVDNNTRTHLKTVLDYNRNLPNQVNWPVRYYPTPEHQAMYQNLVR